MSRREHDLITSVSDRNTVQRITEWSDIFVERYNVDIEGWLSFDFMKVHKVISDRFQTDGIRQAFILGSSI